MGIQLLNYLSSEVVVGPAFFDGGVNGENYLEMLREVVMPQLQIKLNFDELFFQKSGAPPHYALKSKRLP